MYLAMNGIVAHVDDRDERGASPPSIHDVYNIIVSAECKKGKQIYLRE